MVGQNSGIWIQELCSLVDQNGSMNFVKWLIRTLVFGSRNFVQWLIDQNSGLGSGNFVQCLINPGLGSRNFVQWLIRTLVLDPGIFFSN